MNQWVTRSTKWNIMYQKCDKNTLSLTDLGFNSWQNGFHLKWQPNNLELSQFTFDLQFITSYIASNLSFCIINILVTALLTDEKFTISSRDRNDPYKLRIIFCLSLLCNILRHHFSSQYHGNIHSRSAYVTVIRLRRSYLGSTIYRLVTLVPHYAILAAVLSSVKNSRRMTLKRLTYYGANHRGRFDCIAPRSTAPQLNSPGRIKSRGRG